MKSAALELLFGVLTALASVSACAQLGNSSVAVGFSSVKKPLYKVNTFMTPENIEFHEYVNLSGVVFAYHWEGTTKPDLRSFLGNYLFRYQNALSSLSSGRSPVAISDSDFILQTGGRMNHFFGAVFLPAMAPQGMGFRDIQ